MHEEKASHQCHHHYHHYQHGMWIKRGSVKRSNKFPVTVLYPIIHPTSAAMMTKDTSICSFCLNTELSHRPTHTTTLTTIMMTPHRNTTKATSLTIVLFFPHLTSPSPLLHDSPWTPVWLGSCSTERFGQRRKPPRTQLCVSHPESPPGC